MSMPEDEAVAIVGYGGIFPGAGDPEGLWANIVEAVDATTDVPPGRWLLAPSRAFDPRVPQPDKVYATRGGFVGDVALDLAGLNLDPALVRRLDPVFHLALHAAHTAWKSSRTESLDRDRVGVIFGNIVLPTEGSSSFSRAVLGRFFEEGLGITAPPGEATEPLNAFPAGLPAALVAQALGLRGTQFTLDAACASSLYALKLAVDELRSGHADAMITGGVSRPDPLYTQMGFSQLLALSARGKPAPFDVKADGLVVGEGAGLFVLKRLSDAVRQGDAIHAVIRGIGLSNDIHGDLLAPSSEGQLRAMQAAYQQAGWSPWDVDLIECHATGTPVGDAVEVDSLKRLWGDRGSGWSPGQCTIGSVKSNVGHMLTAAGAAGLVKVLLALKHDTLPPTANQTQPSPRLQLEGSPFRILTKAQPWPHRDPARPRRAALSGFGFGGINAHVLIEEWPARLQHKADPQSGSESESKSAPQSLAVASHPAQPARPPRPVAIVGMAAHFGPFPDLRSFQEEVFSGETGGVPVPPGRWWGAAGNGRTERGELELGRFPGYYLDAVRLRVDQFRIPPRELQEMLPQQSLMLTVAADALADARWDRGLGARTGVVIGLGLDQNTNNYQLRWWLANQAPIWNRQLDLGLSEAELDGWIDALRQAVGPPLTANRTMGSLGGLVASRVAREFRIGGPSFSVACDETSGTQALQIAAGWLEREELDAAIVGSVDLAGDLRTVLAASQVAGSAPPGEGAAALVLKRLDDALRDGDRVYAIIRDARAVTGRSIGPADPDDASLSSHGAIGSVRAAIGRPGAATGLAAVVRAALCLYQQIIPGHRQDARDLGGPQFWLRNRAEGPRRAEVRTFGLGGTCHTLSLEAVEDAVQPRGVVEIERAQPLGARRLAVFALEADDRRRLIERTRELIALAGEDPDAPIERLARRWWSRCQPDPSLRLGMAVIAGTVSSLRRGLDKVVRTLTEGRDIEAAAMSEADV
ncbi:MAG TPA: beta-ketoacyl synthase N-terminal-like domain-containing protein, partial [Isosphaeraceae bacterium]|nr:beta-ketoacyl synthase N-terminal-like domain-containing protein [Isosphaeraceae bacterium]